MLPPPQKFCFYRNSVYFSLPKAEWVKNHPHVLLLQQYKSIMIVAVIFITLSKIFSQVPQYPYEAYDSWLFMVVATETQKQ